MASRDETREWLLAERTRVQTHKRELEAEKAREAQLQRELEQVEQELSQHAPARRLPLLDRVRIASPCNVPWSDMVGDARSRHCFSCEKQVYDISAMSRESAEAFLRGVVGEGACVRLFRRADGTILTAEDCPVGTRRVRRKKLLVAAGVSAMAAAGAAFGLRDSDVCRGGVAGSGGPARTKLVTPATVATDEPVVEVMGEIAPPEARTTSKAGGTGR